MVVIKKTDEVMITMKMLPSRNSIKRKMIEGKKSEEKFEQLSTAQLTLEMRFTVER